jgi:MYXO-CTERM domain-containing protein
MRTTKTLLAAAVVAAVGFLTTGRAQAQCDKPGLLIILDKSSSMVTGSVPTGETKWEAARIAVSTITDRYRDSIDFGLAVFPNPDHCNPGSVVVDIGPDHGDDIAALLADAPPTGGNYTPMAETLEAVASYPALSDASLRRAVILITDGWQWCYPYDPATRMDPVDSAAVLRGTGADLHVIGFGDGVDSLVLNRIAWESGTSLPGCNADQTDPFASDNCYHQALGLDTLTMALDAIARHVTEEICDNLDNNCDGAVDEGLTRECTSICGTGSEICTAGLWTGCSAPLPAPEICDGLDNDCDGVVDEGCDCFEGDSRTCGTDVGECIAGLQTCGSDGAWGVCEGGVNPAAEICDGLDNDCNGMVDDGCDCIDGDTRPCGTDKGECSAGLETCVDGRWSECAGQVDPEFEICDGLDNDCDGQVDDGAPCAPGEICVSGACVAEEIPSDLPPDENPDGIHDADSGCGCVVAGRDADGLPALLLLASLFGLLVLARRRNV